MTTPPLCPHTVRRCIEALPKESGQVLLTHPAKTPACDLAIRDCRRALEALLPKPDPAKALVAEYTGSPVCLDDTMAAEESFARWLIQSGKLEVKG